ncbi:MAG: hypothetical protein ACUVQ8_06975 [Nitrososphaeria archaeon]
MSLVVEDPNFLIALGILAASLGVLGVLILLLELRLKNQNRY